MINEHNNILSSQNTNENQESLQSLKQKNSMLNKKLKDITFMLNTKLNKQVEENKRLIKMNQVLRESVGPYDQYFSELQHPSNDL